jgi:hypothetical protein
MQNDAKLEAIIAEMEQLAASAASLFERYGHALADAQISI